jgi:RNA polymerase sigma-70 factor (ECF subfamily)
MRPDASTKERPLAKGPSHAWIAEHILPHETGVRHWLRRSGVSRPDEDDVVQEAYCRLTALARFDQIDSSRAYLFVTVRNVLRERFRRERILRIDNMGEIAALARLDVVPSSERQVSDGQLLALVGRLIEELPERCRNVITLRKIEGLSQHETAQRLNLTQNVVGKEVAHGLRAIAKRLAEEDVGFLDCVLTRV